MLLIFFCGPSMGPHAAETLTEPLEDATSQRTESVVAEQKVCSICVVAITTICGE